MVQTWRADAGNNRDTDITSEIVSCKHRWKHGDNIKTYLLIYYLLPIYKLAYYIIRFSISFMSRGLHFRSNSFYTHKNLISTISAIFLPIFHIFLHNLDTIPGQKNNNPTIFKQFYINFVLYDLC